MRGLYESSRAVTTVDGLPPASNRDFHQLSSFLENHRNASRKLPGAFGRVPDHFRESVDDFSVVKLRFENFEKIRKF